MHRIATISRRKYTPYELIAQGGSYARGHSSIRFACPAGPGRGRTYCALVNPH